MAIRHLTLDLHTAASATFLDDKSELCLNYITASFHRQKKIHDGFINEM